VREAQEVEQNRGRLGRLERGYERVLSWTLRHRLLQAGITLVILALSVWVASGLQLSFIPAQESDTFALSFQMPPGASLEATDRLARQAEAIIKAAPGVVAVQTTVGAGGYENGAFTVRASSSQVANAIRDRARQQLAFLPNLALSAQSYQGNAGTGVTSRNVQVQVSSTRSLDQLDPIVRQVQQQMQAIPGFVDVGSSYTQGRPEIDFQVNEAQARQLSLSNNDIATSVRALVNGDKATTWQSGGDDIDVVVRLPPGQRTGLDAVGSISLPTSAGPVPLTSVATVQAATGPTSIRRYDRQNQIVIGANTAPGYDQNQLQRQLLQQIGRLGLPADVSVSFGGVTQSQNQGFSALFGAMALSVLFVYVVLASEFGSFTQPLVIMLAMPFSFLGAFVALRLAGLALDVTGMIGLIMLLGLVVKNSILLVDFTNRLRRAGLDKHTALERAGAIRLRPILMTSSAIIVGAIPSAFGIHFFSSDTGSNFRRGLGSVLIGGMLTSTLLTLLVVPTAYSLLESALSRVSGWFRWSGRAQLAMARRRSGHIDR